MKLSSLLNLLLIVMFLPIGYYSFTIIQIKQNMQNTDVPEDISANRYLYSGSWPSSNTANELIQQYEHFIIKEEYKPTLQEHSQDNKDVKTDE